MGCLIARGSEFPHFNKPWKLLLLCVVLANLPDVDFVLGIVHGHPNLYHRLLSHSIGFALAVGVLCGLYGKLRHGRFLPMFALSVGACFSHVVLDYLGADTSEPHGVTALWPFSTAYFIAPVTLFSALKKGDTVADLALGIFNVHNILGLMREVVVFSLLLAVQNWYLKNREGFRVRRWWGAFFRMTQKDRT